MFMSFIYSKTYEVPSGSKETEDWAQITFCFRVNSRSLSKESTRLAVCRDKP